MPKVIDTTIFSNDFPALELRIEELWDSVDEIVVCEGNYSFSGKPKPLFLSDNASFQSKYSPKLKVVRYFVRKPRRNPWINEMSQRAFLNNYLRKRGIGHFDTVAHSDCDEIPKGEILSNQKQYGDNLLLQLRNYTFHLNLRNGFYSRARVVLGKHFKGIEKLRQDIFLHELRATGFKRPFIRIPTYWSTDPYLYKLPRFVRYPQLTVVNDAGWHFNNLMNAEDIQTKMKWSSHTELATQETLDLKHISKSMEQATDVYRSDVKFHREEIEFMPRVVRDNQEKWAKFLS